MLDPDDPMVQDAVLGKIADDFINSPLGKYILARVDHERNDALHALKDHDPLDSEGIRGLQNRVKVVERVEGWLQEAVTIGHHAMEELKERG